jgi:hypothetical protein
MHLHNACAAQRVHMECPGQDRAGQIHAVAFQSCTAPTHVRIWCVWAEVQAIYSANAKVTELCLLKPLVLPIGANPHMPGSCSLFTCTSGGHLHLVCSERRGSTTSAAALQWWASRSSLALGEGGGGVCRHWRDVCLPIQQVREKQRSEIKLCRMKWLVFGQALTFLTTIAVASWTMAMPLICLTFQVV